ncbi:MAG TPA: MlaD family protein [Gammaproteobacteria bacterium]|nr:MlaD family protein [Gammaproteobacteria bacterium]
MEDRSHALIAIIFLVVFAVGALLVVWWMLTPGAVRVPYVLESKTSVAGVGEGTAVQFNGIKIGVVKSIKIDPATHRRIQVRIVVDKKFPLPKGSYATVGSSSLVGPTIVDIHLGDSSQIIQTSAQHPAHLSVKQGGLSAMMDEAGEIVAKAKQTLDSVQKIVSDKNVKQISDTLKNIHEASGQLVVLEKDIAPGAKQLPQLIAETRGVMKQAQRLVANANGLVVSARAPLSAVGEAASSAAAFATDLDQQTAPQLNALLVKLRGLTTQLDGLAEELRQTPQSLILGPAKPQPGPGETPPPAAPPGGG